LNCPSLPSPEFEDLRRIFPPVFWLSSTLSRFPTGYFRPSSSDAPSFLKNIQDHRKPFPLSTPTTNGSPPFMVAPTGRDPFDPPYPPSLVDSTFSSPLNAQPQDREIQSDGAFSPCGIVFFTVQTLLSRLFLSGIFGWGTFSCFPTPPSYFSN